jgi:flagellar basal-body rod modification protein FlgD
MATTGTIDSSSYLSNFSIDKKTDTSTTEKTSDKDMFMRLMLAQLQNQNPLNPQDGAEFVAQLAQFTQVEGISKLNTSVQDIASLYRSTQTLQATALVGRDIKISGNTAHFDGNNPVTGTVPAGQMATNATMTIKDSKGAIVANISIGDISSQGKEISWDGKDTAGNKVPEGDYKVMVEGLVGEKRTALLTDVNVRVNSVSVGAGDGTMKLNLANGTSVTTDAIKQIL